jgi:DNA polymerase-1
VEDFCLRDVFGPATGRVWICSDYSQLELRILAVLSQETRLLEAFENDEDIHSLTADLCGISRKAAKGVNYGIIYGAGSAKLEDMTGLSNFDKVFKEAYPGISKFMEATTKQVTKDGFVKTIGGYRLVVPRHKPYIGTNYIVQGSAGDILNRAMIMVDQELKYDDDFPENNKGYLIMCIHDELVFDFELGKAKKVPTIIKAAMEEAGKDLGVITPVDIKRVTQRWSDGKELKL